MDINEQYKAFGLEPPAEGEKATEPAEPSEKTAEDTTNAEGEKEQEAAEPAEQDAATNAKYAAARRKAEAERDKAIADADKYLNDTIASLGLVDAQGKAVTNRAELDAYRKAEAEAARKRAAEVAGLDDGELQQIIDELPEVRQAKVIAEKAAQDATAAKINEQIAAIHELDASISTMDDLVRAPKYDEFAKLVREHGLSFVDAYKLANMDAIMSRGSAAAKQQAINAQNGKAHLTATKTGGSGVTNTVPAEVKAQYRLFNPGMTDEQIAAHYNKNHKGG